MVYLAWQDEDKKYPTLSKAQDAAARYHAKMGSHPDTILCHPDLVDELAGCGMTVCGVPYLDKHVYYVGIGEEDSGS